MRLRPRKRQPVYVHHGRRSDRIISHTRPAYQYQLSRGVVDDLGCARLGMPSLALAKRSRASVPLLIFDDGPSTVTSLTKGH